MGTGGGLELRAFAMAHSWFELESPCLSAAIRSFESMVRLNADEKLRS